MPWALRDADSILALIGLSMLQAFGFTLNQLSIAGFVLSLGLLVDDSIVITENIARRIREGEERTEAAINGTRQIGLAVLGLAILVLAPLVAVFVEALRDVHTTPSGGSQAFTWVVARRK